MSQMMNKSLCGVGLLVLAGCGGYFGSMIRQKAYPLSMVERVNLTPQIRSGDPILLAQHVDRHDQCDITVKRYIKDSAGKRFTITQTFDEGFGPLGGDKYVLPVPTDSSASHGPARMYSKAYSYCNWLDWFRPSESEPWTLEFVFAEETQFVPPPNSFSGIGTKAPTKVIQP